MGFHFADIRFSFRFWFSSASRFNLLLQWVAGLNIYKKHEAYSDSKYRFAVKKNRLRFRKKILLLSDSTFFKLFIHIFAAIIEALIVAGHKLLYTLLIECGRLRC